jgi:hypothetical protein
MTKDRVSLKFVVESTYGYVTKAPVRFPLRRRRNRHTMPNDAAKKYYNSSDQPTVRGPEK